MDKNNNKLKYIVHILNLHLKCQLIGFSNEHLVINWIGSND